MRRILFCLLLTTTLSALYAQTVIPYGVKKVRDELRDVVRSQDGGLLAIGFAGAEYWDNWDASLMKLDFQGNKVFRRSVSSHLIDDYGQAIAEDKNGRIWIGGYSDSVGYHMAWLMCCNPVGEPLWKKTLAISRQRTEVQDLEIAPDGNTIACAGLRDGRAWLALLDLQGNIQSQPIFSQIDNAGSRAVRKVSLISASDGWYLYGGVEGEQGKVIPFFVKTDAPGNLVASVLLSDRPVDETSRCVLTPEGNLLATGTVTLPLLQEEVFTLRIGSSLNRGTVGYQTFGGLTPGVKSRDLDTGEDIIALDGNQYLVVGSTRSHKPGAQVEDMAAWRVNAKGERMDTRMGAYGDKLEDRAVRAIRMYSGDVWICGSQSVGSALRNDLDFAFVRMETMTLPFSAATPEGVEMNTPAAAPALLPGTSSAMSVEVTNRSATITEGLYITAECPTSMTGCFTGLRHCLPRLAPGEKYLAQIPIWADREAKPGHNRLNLSLSAANGQTLAQRSTLLSVNAAPVPDIRLLSVVSVRSGKGVAVPGKGITLEVRMRNDGQEAAKGAYVTFVATTGSSIPGKNEFEIGEWPAGQQRTLNVTVFTEEKFDRKSLPLRIFVSAQNLPDGIDLSSNLQVVDHEDVAVVEPERPNAGKVEIEVRWDDDNSALERREKRDKFSIDVEISGNVEVGYRDVTMILNGQRTRLDGLKSDVVQLNRTNAATAFYIYSLTANVALAPNTNTLQIEVRKGDKVFYSPVLSIYRQLNDRTLYVVSIGVPDKTGRLHWTQKDAQDMAVLFATQQGKMFGYVDVVTMVSEDSTKNLALSQAIKRFPLMQRRGQLHPDDAIIIYLSTHGMVSEEDRQFRLWASDFTPTDEKLTSLSFRENLLEVLDTLPCQKFVFIDACHSGAVNSELQGRKTSPDDYAKALAALAAGSKSLRIITSCGEGEFSYEDPSWQNGAFTKGMKDIFSDTNLCRQLDSNEDHALSLREFFNMLQRQVNQMVKDQRKASQTPYAPQKALEDDVPIWAY